MVRSEERQFLHKHHSELQASVSLFLILDAILNNRYKQKVN